MKSFKLLHSPLYAVRCTLNTSNGFTLIELLVSIVLIGIMAGIGVPSLFGVYQRQGLANTANEAAAAIKSVQASALANDQSTYAQNPPLADCDATHAYVEGYQFVVGAGGTSYAQQRTFRTTAGCATNSATTYKTITFTSGTHFQTTSPSDVGDTISFKTVSGQLAISGNTTLTLANDNFLTGTAKYYVCISSGKIYAQSITC